MSRRGGLVLRIGGSIAAGMAASAIVFISCLWLKTDPAPANAGMRAEPFAFSDFNAVDPKSLSRDRTTVRSDLLGDFRTRWAGLEAEDAHEFGFDERWSVRSSFRERFSFEKPDAPSRSLRRSASFDDRFAGEFMASGPAARSAAVTPRSAAQRVSTVVPTPREAVRSTAAMAAPKRPKEHRFQLASASATSIPLAYAPTNSVKAAKPLVDVVTSRTAIYDITSQTVYLPNGRRLEAHSGLGNHMDDPRHVSAKNTGPTPPNIYELKMRERLFHGVRAIRLIPTDGSKMHGRDGILAHSYLLGPNGQSNGCVSISDYTAFLEAFQRGEVDRLVVVERLAEPPPPRTASDWLKDLFRPS